LDHFQIVVDKYMFPYIMLSLGCLCPRRDGCGCRRPLPKRLSPGPSPEDHSQRRKKEEILMAPIAEGPAVLDRPSEAEEAPNPSPPLPSAQELHKIALTAFALGNQARLRLLEALDALASTKLYFQLGFSSITQYAAHHFQFEHTQTGEYLRTARKLRSLPRSLEALKEGKISLSALVEITRVATEATEESWLNFARKYSFKRLRSEVRHAGRRAATSRGGRRAGSPTCRWSSSWS
jgi:hypothetical protein